MSKEVADPGAGSGSPSVQTSDKATTPGMDFVLGKRGTLAFFTLSVLTLMVAIDGTSISVALPVCPQPIQVYKYTSKLSCIDHHKRPQRNSNRGLLERNLVSALLDSLPAKLCLAVWHLWSTAAGAYCPDSLLRRHCRLLRGQGLHVHACWAVHSGCRWWRLDCPERGYRD